MFISSEYVNQDIIKCVLRSFVGLLIFFSVILLYIAAAKGPTPSNIETFNNAKFNKVKYTPPPESFGTDKGAPDPRFGYKYVKDTRQYPNVNCSNNNCSLIEVPLQYNYGKPEVLRAQAELVTPYNCTRFNKVN